MFRIGIDCRFAATSSGLGRYTREIVSHLLRRKDSIEYVLFVRSQNEKWTQDLSSTTYNLQPTSLAHYSLAEQLYFPEIIRRSAVDLLFSPHFNVPLLCPVPFVVTIHDLILHRYPNQTSLSKRIAYRAVMGHAIRNARRIIAVSDFTAGEIAAVYGDRLRGKIATVHEGCAEHFFRRDPMEQAMICKIYGLERPFFLYVGNAKEHKNVQMLIDAFASLEDSQAELVLVTHGKEVPHLRLCDGVRIIPMVQEEDLPALYSAARVFVTASLYEGFCLPAVEAHACGCPVIASCQGALPEVLGVDATLIEPTAEAFTSALEHPQDPHPPTTLRSWEEAAEKTAQILSEAMEN